MNTPSLTSARTKSNDTEFVDVCPACGSVGGASTALRYVDRLHWLPGRFALVRCAGCGLIRTSPRPSAAALTGFYPTDYVSFGSEKRPSTRLKLGLRRLLRLPYRLRYGGEDATETLEPGRVLDVGCGVGVALAQLARRGWEPWGIEPNAAATKRALEQLGVDPRRIIVAAAEDVDALDEVFDLVLMSHVLEHLHDPRHVLEKACQWLAPGSRILIRVPNVESVESRVFGRYWFGLDVPRHLWHFSPKTLVLLIESLGLEVEFVRPQYQGSSLAGSFAHAVAALRRRRRSYRHSQALYLALLPLASILLGFGQGGAIELMARRPAE